MSYIHDQQDFFEQFSQFQDSLYNSQFNDWSFLQGDLIDPNSDFSNGTMPLVHTTIPTTTPPLPPQQQITPGTPGMPGAPPPNTIIYNNHSNSNHSNTITNNHTIEDHNSIGISTNTCHVGSTNNTTPGGAAVSLPSPQPKKKEEVDHHKRLNELQARFRVNYTRKPNPIKSESEMGIVIMSQEKEKANQANRSLPIQIQRVSRPSAQPMDAETHQRQLDDQLDKLNAEDVTVAELKEMLRLRGKQATGKKAVLLSRLLEEKKNVKGRNRLSQPTLPTRPVKNFSDRRPHSFQSPMKIQLPGPPDFSASAPGSPGSPFYRSIANMQISSPPARRYSPYSPRLSSPDSGMNQWDNSGNLVSPGRRYHTPSTGGQKSYKPFTSSTLATPDREEEINPFDVYYASQQTTPTQATYEDSASKLVDWNDVDSLLKQGKIYY
jgi:hypothetical protein